MQFLNLNKKKSKKNTTDSLRKKIIQEEKVSFRERFIQGKYLLNMLFFLLFAFAILLICFLGQSPAGPPVLANQIAQVHIVAQFPFSYESKIKTEHLIQERKQMIAPIYQLDEAIYQNFSKKMTLFQEGLDFIQDNNLNVSNDALRPIIDKFLNEFNLKYHLSFNIDDIMVIFDKTSQAERNRLFREGLITLKEIFNKGIFDFHEVNIPGASNFTFFNIELSGRTGKAQILSEEEALRILRINILALDGQPDVARALFRVLKTGVSPNLVYDPVKSDEKIQMIVNNIKPVKVSVREGDTIIQPNSLVTPDQAEQLAFYRQQLQKTHFLIFNFNKLFLERMVKTFAILLAALLSIKICFEKYSRLKNSIFTGVFVILINLLLIRILAELSESHLLGSIPMVIAVLPYAMPILLGPILVTILLGPLLACLVALIISTFTFLMVCSDFSLMITFLIASLVGILFCHKIRLRAQAVKAASLSGVVMSIGALILGLLNQSSLITIFQQVTISLITSLLTGIIIVGFLPLFENYFHLTTDIKLLELTDYNHPLLRRLQMIAPGTYHHSLMVANLAERAALEIGVNPLICRCCSLYHDIGKMIKPEYFIENQTPNNNPHTEKTPSISALIIKSHVKEGVKMAEEAKLPSVVIDIIQQHHGTSLIQYFYGKALLQKREEQGESGEKDDFVDESTFRYDGPRPQFKESAIIFFADSVEASSRTLKKPSSQNIEELIDSIFADRINDDQLDECPLDFREIAQIKKSFAFTLLNTLHARIDYKQLKA